MALVWKGNKGLDRHLDCIDDPVGCHGIAVAKRRSRVFGYIFPNRVEVDFCFRVKIIPSRQ